MPNLSILFSVLLLFVSTNGFQENPDQEFRAVHQDILDRLYEVDMEGVEKIFESRRAELENSVVTMLLENYYDFLVIQLRDEYPVYKELKKSRSHRMGYIQKQDNADPIWRAYCQAQTNLQWGIARVKLEFYTRGIWDTRLAFQQLEAIHESKPGFLPGSMSLGLLQTLIGAAPKSRGKWIKMMGMEGNIFEGIDNLALSTKRTNPFWYEAEMLLAYCEGYIINDPNSGKRRLGRLRKERPTLLVDFINSIYLMKFRDTQQALEIINQRIENAPTYLKPHFHFLLGDALLRKGLYVDAIYHLKYFLFHYKGMTLRKEANYKVSMAYYLDGNMEKADDYWVRTARLGYTFLSSDHYAQAKFEAGRYPNKLLFKARMFFDGGYYEEARLELKNFADQQQTTRQLATEFYYRKGRVEHAQGNLDLALANYKLCIENQAEDQWYFAPNAWLQSGYIYTKKAERELATKAFEMATEYPKNPYQESIDSQAKVGTLLLEKKFSEGGKGH